MPRDRAGAFDRLAREAASAARLARWGLAMLHRDTRRPSPVPGSPKFASAREAVERIPDGAVVAVSGLGVQQRASVLFAALRERFEETGHPRRLTLVNVGGHGGRGLIPGTLDELALPGLCARLVTSHFETMPAFLALAAAGRCELQCLPLGVIAQLYDAQRRGEDSVLSEVGLGTFIDPRAGRGSPVQGGPREQLVRVEGSRLRYRLPRIDVALFNVPAADRLGNLYVKGCATLGDSYEIARAAKRSGGLVIANVGRLARPRSAPVFLPARKVDAIVFDPDAEQTPGYFHRDPWSAVTTRSRVPIRAALEQARVASWIGRLGGGLARRSAVDELLFRLAAFTLASQVKKGARIAIGAGLPEEIARVVFESGRLGDVTFLVESGAIGGLPGSGAYFGASFSPRELVSTAQLFARCRRRLDAACLGALEVDGAGNVNVSRRGRGVRHYAGPGGFMDFTSAARTVVFVSGWMRGRSARRGGRRAAPPAPGSTQVRRAGRRGDLRRRARPRGGEADLLRHAGGRLSPDRAGHGARRRRARDRRAPGHARRDTDRGRAAGLGRGSPRPYLGRQRRGLPPAGVGPAGLRAGVSQPSCAAP